MEIVKKLIRIEYQRGAFDYLKFLLSQEMPSELSRMNSYFQSLNNARLNQLKDLRVSISQSERVERELQESLSKIETDAKQLVSEQASLQKKREEKKEIVRKFKLEIKKTHQAAPTIHQIAPRIHRIAPKTHRIEGRQSREGLRMGGR